MGGLTGPEGFAELLPDTDPGLVEPFLLEHRPRLLQFSEPLPEPLLDAAAAALAEFPQVGFRVYGRRDDPSLGWLGRFAHVRDLTIDLWHATSFDLLASFEALSHVSLGQTRSRRPSLGFLRSLPELEVLRVEAHDRDFAAIGEVATLRELYLRVPRAKTLDSLRGHPQLQVARSAEERRAPVRARAGTAADAPRPDPGADDRPRDARRPRRMRRARAALHRRVEACGRAARTWSRGVGHSAISWSATTTQ